MKIGSYHLKVLPELHNQVLAVCGFRATQLTYVSSSNPRTNSVMELPSYPVHGGGKRAQEVHELGTRHAESHGAGTLGWGQRQNEIKRTLIIQSPPYL